MSKKFTLYLFSILTIGVVAIWSTDQYSFSFLPPELSNPFVMFLSVIGFVASVVSAVKAFQFIGESFFPPNPEPSKEDKLLQKLRELPWSVSDETAKEYTGKILGDRSNDFWAQIKANQQNADILNYLTEDPFMLEGLLSVYRNERGALPKNIGALLDKLIRTQWTPEKVKVRHWVEIDDLLYAFGELVIRTVPDVEYPSGNLWSDQPPPRYGREPYVQMLRNIGESIFANRRKGNWLIVIFGVIWILLKIIVLLPINLLYEVVRRISVFFRWWKILDILGRIKSFLYNIKLSHRIHYVEASRLLLIAEKIHLIERDEQSIRFSHKGWVDYFAAQYVIQQGSSLRALKWGNKWDVETWNRLDPERDGIAIVVCGITEDPIPFIRELMEVDPLLATKCILSGIEEVPDDIHEYVRQASRTIISDVRSAGEKRSYDFAKEYLKLWNDPSDTELILNAIRDIEPVRYISLPLAKLIFTTYGTNAVEILLRRLETAEKELTLVILTLGWIGDSRAIEPLQKLADSTDSPVLALAVLATCFNDQLATSKLLEYLLVEDELQARKEAWYTLSQIGEKAISWSIETILTWGNEKSHEWQYVAHSFLDICEGFDGNQRVGAFLYEKLMETQNPDKVKFILDAFGRVKYQGAYEKLVENLSSLDIEVRIRAIESLGKLEDQRAVRPLIGQLYSKDLFAIQKAVFALGKLKSPLAITALAGRLYDDDVNQEGVPFKYGNHPVSMEIVDALIEIGTPEALTSATAWCKKQLGSQQSAYYAGMQPTLSNVVEHYLEFKLGTREAYQAIREWNKKQEISQ